MRREQKVNTSRIGATLVLVNEMRRLEEAAERMRLVVKAIALRDGVQYELPQED